MKKAELFFSFLLLPVDFIMIILAGLSAYRLRFAEITTGIRPVIFNLPFTEYFKALLIIAVLWLIVFMFSGLYNIRSARKLAQEISRVILACSTGLVLIVILIFFRGELFNSRFIVLAGWLFAIFYVSIGRSLIRSLQRRLFSKGYGVHKVIVVGSGDVAKQLLQNFTNAKRSGFAVIKHLPDFSPEQMTELTEFIKDREVDEIIQADPNLEKKQVLALFDFANTNHITFKYVADLLGVKVLHNEFQDFFGVPIIEIKRTTLDGWGRIVKRFFDIVFSALLIIILSPILLITAIAIKIDSRGPVFFSHKDDGSPYCRIGAGGMPFHYFKFRSMKPKTDEMRYHELINKNLRKGPMIKIKDDPRITRVGKFIRRFSIDELPELFLVFIGSMSLVGPRPHLPEEVAKYEKHHRKVLVIKPGITGLSQISGRSDLDFEEEVKLDSYYI